jgi:hypothetical protein
MNKHDSFFKKILRRLFREWKDKENLLFRISTGFKRYLISQSSDTRPTSYPFISGDTFRSKAQHTFDEISVIFPENVISNDIVFVDIRKINEFFKVIHPKINCRYKLITHNGDEAVTEDLVSLTDDKVIYWYGQNINVVHPKVSAIPIGLENMYYYNNGIIGKCSQGTCSGINRREDGDTKILGFFRNVNLTGHCYPSLIKNHCKFLGLRNTLRNLEVTSKSVEGRALSG